MVEKPCMNLWRWFGASIGASNRISIVVVDENLHRVDENMTGLAEREKKES